jgi:acylphosphatase
MTDVVARHLRMTGRVQGVFFRESMRIEAGRQGVVGWVRNNRDGSVEAIVQGPAEAVDRMVDWAHRGSQHARVASVEVSDADPGEFDRFETRETS